MEPKILIMGENQDYYEIQMEKEVIHKTISEMSATFGIEGKEEELLKKLRKDDKRISANQLRTYGATISFQEDMLSCKTVIEGLSSFFEGVDNYAQNHGADYVLVQNLKIKYAHLSKGISGLIQLLIE